MFNGKPQATASFLPSLDLSPDGMNILSGMVLVRRQPLLCRLDILVRRVSTGYASDILCRRFGLG
jgi:hypothetical protein